MSLVRLTIKGISYSHTQNGAYALILNEVDGERKLPIVIGAFEAQAIAIAIEKDLTPPRPLTHDRSEERRVGKEWRTRGSRKRYGWKRKIWMCAGTYR